jgi:hypothetical protein
MDLGMTNPQRGSRFGRVPYVLLVGPYNGTLGAHQYMKWWLPTLVTSFPNRFLRKITLTSKKFSGHRGAGHSHSDGCWRQCSSVILF